MAKKTYAQKKAEAKAKKARLASMTPEELVAEMTYDNCAIEHIIAWCKLNNQVDWLKAKMLEKVQVKDKKTKQPTGEERIMDFMTLKRDFNEMFGWEKKESLKMLPKDFKKQAKAKEPNMFELVASL